jgi:RHS repeat-associated protein
MASGGTSLSAAWWYSAFGEVSSLPTGGATPRLGYQSQLTDPATGTVDMTTRQYVPSLGRFTTRDSLFGESTEPMSLNQWAFAAGNPVTMTDVAGQVAMPIQYGQGGAAGIVRTAPPAIPPELVLKIVVVTATFGAAIPHLDDLFNEGGTAVDDAPDPVDPGLGPDSGALTGVDMGIWVFSPYENGPHGVHRTPVVETPWDGRNMSASGDESEGGGDGLPRDPLSRDAGIHHATSTRSGAIISNSIGVSLPRARCRLRRW